MYTISSIWLPRKINKYIKHTHTQGNQKAKVWGNNAIQINYKSKFFAGWTMHALNGAA